MTRSTLIRRRAAFTGALALALALGTILTAQLTAAGAQTSLALIGGVSLGTVVLQVLRPIVASVGSRTYVYRCPQCPTEITEIVPAGESPSPEHQQTAADHSRHTAT